MCKTLSLADISVTCHTPLVIGLPIVLVLSVLMRHSFLKWPYANLNLLQFWYFVVERDICLQYINCITTCLSNPKTDPTPDKVCLCLSNSLRNPSLFVQHPIIFVHCLSNTCKNLSHFVQHPTIYVHCLSNT